MPATRSQVRRQKIIDHAVDFGDGVVITFTFDANKVTDAWMQEWTRAESEEGTPKLNDMLADLIESWDILEIEHGPAIPVNAEEVGRLFSLRDKMRVMAELSGLPTDAEGNVSRNTSSTPSMDSTSTPASPPNGQQTSQTPEPVASPSSPQPT